MLLFAGSYLVRLALMLGVVWLVMQGRWERAVACLVGFTVVRVLLARVWGKLDRDRTSADGGADRDSHA